MREFIVKKGVMGYIVNIGCQVAGFTTKEDLLKAITEYVNDPEATENKYYQPKSAWVDQTAVNPAPTYGGTSDTYGIMLNNANTPTTACGVTSSEPCEPAGVTISSCSYTTSNATTSDIPYAEVVASGSISESGIKRLRETVRDRA
jgi:hypothetical protein